MSELANFWNLILESNTFNFIVLLVLAVIVMQKLKVGTVVQKLRDDIVDAIENSKQVREQARKHLDDAKHKIEHIDDEILGVLTLASKQADNVAASISEGVERKLQQIKNNTKKVIDAEEKTLIASLTDKTSRSSVELAKKYVKSRLVAEPDLHKKYIEESINELDKVKL